MTIGKTHRPVYYLCELIDQVRSLSCPSETHEQRDFRPDCQDAARPNYETGQQNNERFVVDRRREPTVVIMSLKDYVDTIAPAPEWLRDIQGEAKRKGLDKLKMRDINRMIAEVRRDTRKTKATKPVAR